MHEEYNERIGRWRQRWKEHPRWVDDVISSLRRASPDKTADEIALFPWYTPENEFHPLRFSPQSTSLILDLRGIPLRSLDLANLHLPFALLEGADFFRSNLKDADLSYCRAQGAVFHQAVLTGARFIAAELKYADLSMSDLTGADLTRAQLEEADLGWAHLQEASFRDAFLRGAKMERVKAEETDFTAADLSDADLSVAVCTRAGFENARMEKSQLVAAHLEETNLINADLQNADLSLAYLNGAYLKDANLRGADLTRVYLDYADLENADLSGAVLFASRLTGADLRNADLSETVLKDIDGCRADFRGADLRKADLSGAELLSTRLENCDLRETRLTNCQLRSPNEAATVNENTLFGWTTQVRSTLWRKPNRSQWLIPPPSKLSEDERESLDFNQVRSLYNQVRMLFKDNGLYRRSAEIFGQEKYWRTRGELFEGRWIRFLIRWLCLEKLTGYGEKPLRVFIAGLGIIILFAVAYLFSGLWTGEELIKYPVEAGALTLSVFLSDILRSLSFSALCFITFNLGDLRPAGAISQVLMSLEGLAGFFTVLLWVVTSVRKIGRE
jgi:uncharacterized protein YjbI with pentapeptide repeats